MSIIGHWRDATGFNTTDYTVTMGKPVAQCSVEELSANPMCGSVSPFANVAYTGVASEMINNNIVNLGGAAPFTYPIASEHSETWQIAGTPSGDIRKQYRRTIFVACPSNITMPSYFMSENTDSRILIVEDIAYPNKLVINYGNTSDYGNNVYRTVNFKVSSVACKHTCDRGQSAYATAPSQVEYTSGGTTTYYNIYPVWLYVVEGEAYIVLYEYLCFSGGRYKSADTDNKNYNFIQRGDFQSFNQTTPKWLAMGYNPNPSAQTTTLHDIFPNGYADPVPLPAVFSGDGGRIEYATTNLAPDGAGVVYGLQMNNNVSAGTYVCRLDVTLKADNQWYRANTMCRMGCYFVNNGELLKPIIQDGIVIGYGTPQEESEIDKYTDLKHPVPTGPGGGGGGGDDDDPSDAQSWGGAYSGAGAFSKFYLCTATDLANLRTWFGGGGSGDEIPDGFDPMGQVLGLLQYPVSISGTALAAEEIVFRSGKTIVHTNVNATRSTGGFLHLDCGYIDIPRRMQERGVPFLDFETTLEVYVPFCGTAPLDVQTCVGKTLTCDLYIATATGDVSAVIAAGGHPVAYMSGNMAESLPISSAGYGMYLAACKSTWGNGVSQVMNQITGGTTDTVKNVNQAALNETLSYGQTGGWGQSELLAESYNNPTIGRGMSSLASAKGTAIVGLIKTGLNAVNAAATGYEQYQRVKHASYTSVSGSFTSCAAWNYPFTPYVKITRPHKQIPEGNHGSYKHTAGIPLVETKILSGAPGLTTCVNPDVSGIANATAQEKDIIYRALVNGVIV